MKIYNLQVTCSKQEDGLWRAEVPNLQGCWVDAPTLQKALNDIQEVAAMLIDIAKEVEEQLPDSVIESENHLQASLPVVLGEHAFKRTRSRSVTR